MDVELLVVSDCPSERAATVLLRTALRDVGLSRTRFHTPVIASQHVTAHRGFIGSPTILIDGSDPFAEPGRGPAIACRIYSTPSGPAGIPPLGELRQALKRAASTPR